jgi:hypothetical protein
MLSNIFSATSIIATLAILVSQSLGCGKVCSLSLVRHQVPLSDFSKTNLPPPTFGSWRLVEQYIRAACCSSISKRESAHILQIAAREIWPSSESLSGRT